MISFADLEAQSAARLSNWVKLLLLNKTKRVSIWFPRQIERQQLA